MLRVELMTVGRELLIGRTLNTNAHWIGARFARMGTLVKMITTVDDDLDEISASVRRALERMPDFLVVVGGLGPTPDDMTLKGLALGLGRRMRQSPLALDMIREHYASTGMPDLELTPPRRKMAVLPAGGKPLRNDAGTAPGVRLEEEGTVVFSLPGVPAEMRSIFRSFVEPEVRSRLGPLSRKSVQLRLEGIMESAIAPIISKAMKKNPGAYIKSHPKGVEDGVSRLEVEVAVVANDPEKAKSRTLEVIDQIIDDSVAKGATVKSGPGLTVTGKSDRRRT